MINYKEEYINSILANMAYINFNDNRVKNLIGEDLLIDENADSLRTLYIDSLEEKSFLINNFAYSLYLFRSNFIVEKQIVTGGLDSFSATKYRLSNDIEGTNFKKGQIFVAYRGTGLSWFDWGDGLTDFGLTITSKLKFSWTQEAQALDFLQGAIGKEKIKNDVYIVGHSLGGYLAARSAYYLSSSDLGYVKGVSTFNGAGFTILDGGQKQNENYRTLKYKTNNFYSLRGFNFTSNDVTDTFYQKIVPLFTRMGARYGISAENESTRGNHGIVHLVNVMGLYYILDKLLINSTTNKLVETENIVEYEKQKIYSINRIMMQAVAEKKDFLLMLDSVSWKILRLFGLETKNLDIYSTPISQILSLGDFFNSNIVYKLRLIDSDSKIIENADNNNNRSLIYSLLEDLSYYAMVPDTFSDGIFDRGNIRSDLYNVTKYTKEYIDYRVLYNEIYCDVLENKVLNDLPVTFKKEILNKNIFSKFALIDQINTNPSGDAKIIYVNTTEDEYEDDVSGNIKIIYFKNAYYEHFNTFKKNALIFDTPLSDQFTINGNDSLIKPSTGINNININRNTQNAVIEINSDLAQVDLYNNSFDYFATLKFPYKTSNQIKLVNAASKEGPINIILKFISENGIFSTCVGTVNLELSDLSITHKEIINLISIFPEVFNTRTGSSLKFDQSFIDNYTEATRYKFKSIGMTSYSQGSAITKEHANYVNNKIEKYRKSIGVL